MISAAILDKLVCEIVIPEDFDAKSQASQQLIDPREDQRRFPRHRCRIDAVLRYESTFPALRRPCDLYRIMIRNLSRGGLGFLHGEEMFPHERARLVFLNGTERVLTIMRCRRIGPKCYEVGAEFDELLQDLSEGNWR